jgi:hypothetical protein
MIKAPIATRGLIGQSPEIFYFDLIRIVKIYRLGFLFDLTCLHPAADGQADKCKGFGKYRPKCMHFNPKSQVINYCLYNILTTISGSPNL